MRRLARHALDVVRRGPLLAALCGCFLFGPAFAVDLEADLSTHYIEIRTTFRGAQITVFGALMDEATDEFGSPLDVIVVVRGPPEMIAIRRKEEMGPIWANRTAFTAENVPSFYYVASTRPIDAIVDISSLARYRIGFKHLVMNFTQGVSATSTDKDEKPVVLALNDASADDTMIVDREGHIGLPPLPGPFSAPAMPGVEDSNAFQGALIRLMTSRRTFYDNAPITFVRPHLFRAEVTIPSTVPDGNYGAEVYVVRNKEVLDAEFTVFVINKKGLEAQIYGLAQKRPLLHGLLGVLIAVTAGWISELAFRRR